MSKNAPWVGTALGLDAPEALPDLLCDVPLHPLLAGVPTPADHAVEFLLDATTCSRRHGALVTIEHALDCENDACEEPGQVCVTRQEDCTCTYPVDIAEGVRMACACGAVSAAAASPSAMPVLLWGERWVHWDRLVWLCPVCGHEPDGLCCVAPWADDDPDECAF